MSKVKNFFTRAQARARTRVEGLYGYTTEPGVSNYTKTKYPIPDFTALHWYPKLAPTAVHPIGDALVLTDLITDKNAPENAVPNDIVPAPPPAPALFVARSPVGEPKVPIVEAIKKPKPGVFTSPIHKAPAHAQNSTVCLLRGCSEGVLTLLADPSRHESGRGRNSRRGSQR